MKKRFVIPVFFCLVFFVVLDAGIIVDSSSEYGLNVGVSIPDIRFIEKEFLYGNTYSTLIVPEAGQLDVGKPDVPVFANWILIPNGTSVSISTFPGDPVIYDDVNLPPLQPEPSDFKDAPLPPFTKDEPVFATDSDYPGIFAETETIKQKRGQDCTILWIYPYQFNPVQNRLLVYPDLKVSVTFNGIVEPIPSNLKTGNLESFLKAVAVNAEAVLAAEENAEDHQENQRDRTDGCELLIITDPDYENAANTLAAWKIRKGIYTKVVDTNTTGNTRNQIEDYLDDAHDDWEPAPSYFLFIGDAEDIPVWYLTDDPGNAADGTNIGTDFFYADYNDPPDYVPDFGYGRLSIDSEEEADSLVARIIRYERSPSGNSDYYTNILNAACFQDGESWGNPVNFEEPDSVANRRFCKTSEDVRNYLGTQGYSSQREYVAYNRVSGAFPGEIFPTYWNDTDQQYTYIYENDNPPDGGIELPANMQKPVFPWDGDTAGISSAFNNGKFLALFRAHGGRGGWGDPDFHRADVDALNNGEDRPFIWSITCQSGWFDNETDDWDYGTGFGSECFAEHWLRHDTGGSCGVIASTRNSLSGYNDRMIWGMMDGIWPNFTTWCNDPFGDADPIYKMSDVINYGKAYMFTKYAAGSFREETMELFHWFGDPTAEMWTSEPFELISAEVTGEIGIGTSEITVEVNPAIEDMLVSICTENADNLFGTALTNALGIATVELNHSINLRDEIFVTITKHDYKPYEFVTGWYIWEGSVSSQWNGGHNWSAGLVPDEDIGVVVPSETPFDLTIWWDDAVCRDITIENDAIMYFVADGNLDTYGAFINQGHISVEYNEDIHLRCRDDFFNYGTFNAGHSLVELIGTGTQQFITNFQDFYNFLVGENSETEILFDDLSVSNQLIVNGELSIGQEPLSIETFNLIIADEGNLIINNGSLSIEMTTNIFGPTGKIDMTHNNSYLSVTGLINAGLIDCGDTFTPEIHFLGGWINAGIFNPGHSSCYFESDIIQVIPNVDFYDLYIDKIDERNGGEVFSENSSRTHSSPFQNQTEKDLVMKNTRDVQVSLSDDIAVHDLHIENGILNSNDLTIEISGNWHNLVGEDGFIEGNGTLIINGSGSQYIYGETLNNLVLNKPSGELRFAAPYTTVCNSYEWINGSINVIGGTFTAFDLVNEGIFGEITVGSGELNFHQDGDQYVDLNAELTIYSGSMNIYGGSEASYWPYACDASLTMSGGTLSLIDNGILLYDTPLYTFTEDITAGTIRTAYDFTCALPDFNPTGGTIELFGSIDANLHHNDGSNFHHIRINKFNDALRSSSELPQRLIQSPNNSIGTRHRRDGSILRNSRSNRVDLTEDIIIHGDLTIDDGFFDTNDFDIYLAGDWTNNVGIGAFIPCQGSVIFNGEDDADIKSSETFYHLELNKTNASWHDLEIMDDISITIFHNLDLNSGTLEMNDNSDLNIWHDLNITEDAGLNAFMDIGLSISIGGNWQNQNITYDSWNGFYPGTSTITFNGSENQTLITNCPQEDFFDLIIDNTAGNFRPSNNIRVFNDLTINAGTWQDNIGNLTHSVYGDFTVESGAGWNGTSNNTLNFKGTSDQNISFDPVTTNGYFSNVIIDKTGERPVLSDLGENSGSESANSEITRNMQVNLVSDVIALGGGSLLIEEGTFDLGGKYYRCTGDVTINDGGTLSIDENAWLEVGNENALSVNNGGKLELLGSGGNEAKITHHAGYFDLNIEIGGTLSAVYGIFEYMSADGVYIKDGAIIDAVNSFHNCTFRYGESDGTLMRIDNDQTLSASNVSFPVNTWNGLSNVLKSVDAGEITFIDAAGDFAGPAYEDDAFNRIFWTGFNPDLQISNAEWTPTDPYVCDEITVTITVQNDGNLDIAPGTEFYLDIYYNPDDPPVLFDIGDQYELIEEGLPAGEFIEVQFDMINDVTEIWNSYIQVDTDDEITELNEDNNISGPEIITWQNLPVIDDLTIQIIGENVELNWTYPTEADHFNIYKSLDPDDFSDAEIEISEVNSFSEPAVNEMLFYRVTAVKDCFPVVLLRENEERLASRNK